MRGSEPWQNPAAPNEAWKNHPDGRHPRSLGATAGGTRATNRWVHLATTVRRTGQARDPDPSKGRSRNHRTLIRNPGRVWTTRSVSAVRDSRANCSWTASPISLLRATRDGPTAIFGGLSQWPLAGRA